MNIIIIKEKGITPYQGGIARISYDLMNAFNEKGVNTILLSWIKEYHLEYDDNHYFFPDAVNMYSDENFIFISDLCFNKKIDIIINQCFNLGVITFLNKLKTGFNIKIISVIHNNNIEYSEKFIFRKEWMLKSKKLSVLYDILKLKPFLFLNRQLARLKYYNKGKLIYDYSDKVVLVSQGNISDFLFLINNRDPLNKLIVIENFTNPILEKISLDEKCNNIVWCGTVSYDVKKTDWMLEIWKLVEDYSKDWNLYILGDSPQFDVLKDYSRKLGLKRVYFEGRVNPQTYYKKASILCCTSVSESFGLVLIEAMKYKVVPVAFASSPSIKNILSHSGVLVKPYDKQDFALKVLELMSNSNCRKFLAERCYIDSQLYYKDVIVEKWIELFNKIL